MNQTADSVVDQIEHEHSHHGPRKGPLRWLLTVNHKDVGTMYLVLALVALLVGGVMALVIRAELFQPGLQLTQPQFFNSLTTMHGLTMIFLAIMPGLTGLANWMVPLQVGADDMYWPRVNNWAFWMLPPAAIMLWIGFFMPQGAPGGGWTLYAPLSSTYAPPSIDWVIMAIHIMGISSILGALNIILTILKMRAKGMRLWDMPLFTWTWLITGFLLLLAMPTLAIAVTMLLTDRHLGTAFFDATNGGDPVLFQHIFWFFGHPEVYIMILPAFGVVSEIVPAFSRKPLFGRTSMIWAVIAITFLSAIVWAHHMFTVGLPVEAQVLFMYTTMLIAIPTGIKIFNWVATMWRGSMTFEAPMLWALAFIFLFTIGGFSGLMLADVPADYQYHDTYFVVAHLHYVVVTGSLFAIIAGVYYWLPKWTGHMYNEKLSQWHFWLSAISVNVTFFPMHFAGLAGMPRRIPDYPLQFMDFNMISTVGAFVFGFSQLLFIWLVIQTIRGGKKAGDRPWDGAKGLEWTLSSPPPYHTFTEPPSRQTIHEEGPHGYH
ncbi:cytochrome c oxidase subunit I [Guyparkeria hydrothermalis]|uniref:cytochrome c oxidase subunit I n=1 Tax=Guyparkeria TaxID=2035712 RepID=UPI0010AC426A|nr:MULTISPECIES: cytochrome c oxidase subunit I [Guyparkeria]MCL7750135.1 cytochrome c oxidase subunit I [Guyparkeria hydrothermalis]TKA89238.1 cytochrome c oxidase subunit I [Guyparkeria sp. SB14A]